MKRLFLLSALALLAIPSSASAFCGFYVGGGGVELFNDATQVVLAREGTTTTLSMQNRYSGPAEDFAMVVPVPEVLMEGDVKTIEDGVFERIDGLTAPRLVEYAEQDPCYWENQQNSGGWENAATNNAVFADAGANESPDAGSVTVEAQFKEGEYEISILSATESTALETYLADNNFNVPAGAAPYYQPYIDAGMYFFVAKVDPNEVAFDSAGNAILSPLRFQYESADFNLPIRLGMLNSAGQQDLIVYVLASAQRYTVVNYPTTTIPTNIEVTDAAQDDFGSFYKSLFARTLKEHPGAVVTEYAWPVGTCDPCPPGPYSVTQSDLVTLGFEGDTWDVVITRLHARYDKDEVGEDLVFGKADPIVGGREIDEDGDGEIDQGAFPSEWNNFQGRYIIRRPWTGPVTCSDPQWGVWGAPMVDSEPSPNTTGGEVFGGDPDSIGALVSEDIEELDITASGAAPRGVGGSGGNGGNGGSGGSGGSAGDRLEPKASATCSTGAGTALAPLGIFLLVGLFIRRLRH